MAKKEACTCSYRKWRRHFLLPAVDTEDQLQFKGNYPSLHKLKNTQWLTVLIIAEDQGSVSTIHMRLISTWFTMKGSIFSYKGII